MRFTIGLFLALFASSLLAAEPARPFFEIMATGKIEIGPDGTVLSHKLKRNLQPAVQALIEKNIASWRFEPILADGKPVVASTKLRLSLLAEPMESGDYQLRVQRVYFGEPERSNKKLSPPHFPSNALKAGLGAKVLLVLKLDGQGKVVDAFARQTSLTMKGRENVVKRWREEFERASLLAARKWQFTPGSVVNGEPIESFVAVPVHFNVGRHRNNTWHAFVPGPVRPTPWVDESESLAQAANLKDGELMSLDSRFRLQGEIVGKLL